MQCFLRFFFGILAVSLFVLCNSLLAAEKAKTPPQYTIQITDPTSEQTFQNSTQELPVTVSVTPSLEEGDQIQIYADGNPAGQPSSSTTITIPWLPRGSHTLQARVIQPAGKGAESETITIYQQRTTPLLPPPNQSAKPKI
jgi:hypothetical protein